MTGSAIVLFLFIYFIERRLPGSLERNLSPKIFGHLETNDVNAIEITFTSTTNHLRAEKQSDRWTLTDPKYPAQETAIKSFVETLAGLRAYDKLAPHEVLIQGTRAFGFEIPRAKIAVDTRTNHFTIDIGSATPLTNNIYIKVEETGDVYVTDGKILENLPNSPDSWRSAALVELDGKIFNHLQVRTGQRTFEIERNSTNNLWRITRPVPARGDQESIAELLRILRLARVNAFISDTPAAELDRFGLQTPPLELALLQGTNRIYTVEFGNVLTNDPKRVYARLVGQSNVVAVDAKWTDYLRQPYKEFHDKHLVSFNPNTLDRISVRAVDAFVLQRQSDRTWTIGEKGARADPLLMGLVMTNLGALEIEDIAKEVPTDADLKSFGLINPLASFALYETLTNAAGIATNILFTEVSFGSVTNAKTYSRRLDETPVYITPAVQAFNLPRSAFQMRDRRIWNFNPTNVLSLTLTNAIGTNELVRSNGNWSSDQVRNAAIEETLFRLGQLQAFNWVAKGEPRMRGYGIVPGSLVILVKVQNGNDTETLQVQFGTGVPTGTGNVYAAVLLPGDSERVIFEFPGGFYRELIENLPVPKQQ
jgi:hypothetical protein